MLVSGTSSHASGHCKMSSCVPPNSVRNSLLGCLPHPCTPVEWLVLEVGSLGGHEGRWNQEGGPWWSQYFQSGSYSPRPPWERVRASQVAATSKPKKEASEGDLHAWYPGPGLPTCSWWEGKFCCLCCLLYGILLGLLVTNTNSITIIPTTGSGNPFSVFTILLLFS